MLLIELCCSGFNEARYFSCENFRLLEKFERGEKGSGTMLELLNQLNGFNIHDRIKRALTNIVVEAEGQSDEKELITYKTYMYDQVVFKSLRIISYGASTLSNGHH